ncbi:MAG: 30S ribosomal protein S9 [Armatimonadetes bacterium CG_4_8_14_3_um_filter_58_9]|nr:MAG: 30S ribosomal protein S9 [Armatimonadetes bacterium CG_4_8_14_3_um_filter_58_9]
MEIVVSAETKLYATGHRKNAVARVWLTPGEGRITINKRTIDEYLPSSALQQIVLEPFALTGKLGIFNVDATASGGGKVGQAGAVRHGIARALEQTDETLHTPLRVSGLLTRDPRVKERKKYGRKRARRGFQFSKR